MTDAFQNKPPLRFWQIVLRTGIVLAGVFLIMLGLFTFILRPEVISVVVLGLGLFLIVSARWIAVPGKPASESRQARGRKKTIRMMSLIRLVLDCPVQI